MLNLKEGEIYYSIEDLKGYEVVTYRSGYWYLCCFKVTCSAIKHIFDMTPQEEFSKKFFTSHLDAMEANYKRQKSQALKALEVVKKLRKEQE